MYEPVPDGRFRSGDNVIWIYDLYGNLLKTYYIPASSDGTHREIEAVMFDNGRMILQFNENGRRLQPQLCQHQSVSRTVIREMENFRQVCTSAGRESQA